MIDLQELKEKEFFLLTGDSLERLKEIPDNSIDSIVTDPPYGLGKEPDALQMLKDWIQTGHHDVKAKSGFMGKEWDAFVPQPVLWAECLRVLKPGGHILSFAGTRTYDLVVLGLRMAGFEIRDQLAWVYGSGFPKSMDVSKSIQKRNNSKQWQGWGTALKPAHEPIVMARKPVVGTIAQNVLMWHTGALNIDGCRIPLNGECDAAGANTPDTVGRFPANLIHDGSDEVISVFPDSTGAGKSLPQVKITGYGNKNTGNGTSDYFGGDRIPFDSGSGSAARFFYCAKASRNDRHDGIIDDPEPQFKHGDTLRKIENVDTVGNNHPTVKPTALMRYLVRLVTPPNGIVLDPFNGSGSTGKAAVLEGFKYIGCDLDENYINISRNRIQYAVDNREIINSPVKSDKKKIEKVVKSTAATLECFFE